VYFFSAKAFLIPAIVIVKTIYLGFLVSYASEIAFNYIDIYREGGKLLAGNFFLNSFLF